jgi:hypothetical protein
MRPAFLEVQARAGDQVFYRSRYEDFACRRSRRDTCGNVDGDALYIMVSDLDLPGMQATADFNTQRTDGLGDRASTSDPASRPVEGGEEAVSQGFDLTAPVTREFAPYRCVMSVKQVVPALVAHLFGARG